MSIVLVLCMILSCVAFGSVTTAAAPVASEPTSYGSTAALDHLQGSAVLHCFDWSYKSIEQNLDAIKNAGYTAVQTSPVQPPKDYSAGYTDNGGQWWKLYQPLGVRIADGNNWLGTKAELKSLCTAADAKGIKVIVDIVANHMADNGLKKNGLDNVSSAVDSQWRQSQYWHSDDMAADDDNNRYKVTHGHIQLPDLNTGHSDVANAYKNLLIELINLGVDGFRFDAAKHIELPGEDGGSNFWPTVIDGSKSAGNNIYYYGEILNGAGTSMANYAKYMSYTDNYAGDKALAAANSSNASSLADGNSYKEGATPDKSVLWVESHDTYMGESGTAGLRNTSGVSDNTVIKAWAIVGSRAKATALFFARPHQTIGMASSDTTWKSAPVAEVNKFKNYFDGQSEYLSSEGNVAYNERGTTGVVISKLDGGGQVNLTAHAMAAGTYKDQVSGNTFTVSGGKISGSVGSSGVAVVYNATPPGPSVNVSPGSTKFTTDSLTVTLSLSNATSGSYSVDGGAYTNFTGTTTVTLGAGKAYDTKATLVVKASSGSATSDPVTYTYTKADPNAVQTITFDNSTYNWSNVYCYIYSGETGYTAWPGTQMSKSSGNLYTMEVPEGYENGSVIFTESADATTNRYPAEMEPGLVMSGSSMIFGANHSWTEDSGVKPTTPTTPTSPTTPTQPTTAPVGKVLIGDVDQNGRISIKDATYIQIHLAEMQQLTGNGLVAADVNKDGNVTVQDVSAMQRYLAHYTDSSCYAGKYTDGTEPETQPTTPTTPTTPVDGQYIYFDNNAYNWSNVYCYLYTDDGEVAAWPGTQMTKGSNNVYYMSVPSGYENAYAMFTESDGSANRYPADMEPGLPLGGKSMQLSANHTWAEYGGSQPVTTPTQPTTPVDDGNYIYFQNVYSWGTVYAHMWNSKDTSQTTVWHGTQMEYRNGGAWRVEVPDGYDCVVFNDGGSNQTDDLTLQIGKIYDDTNHTWTQYGGTDYTTPTAGPGDDTGDTYTIYFTNNAGWSGTIYCSYWGGSSGNGFPGTAMTLVSGITYKFNVPKDATYMLFTNGSSAAQTGNVPVEGSASYQTNGQAGNGWYNVQKIG